MKLVTLELAAAARFGITPSKVTAVRRAFRIVSDKGTFALKESRQTKTDILFIHAAKEHLYKQDMANLDRYVLTPDAVPYADLEGHLFVMSPWVDSREAHYDSPSDVVQAAMYLAKLHLCGRGFEPPLVSKRILWGAWPSLWQERLDSFIQYKKTAEEQVTPGRFDRQFLRYIDEHLEQGQEALDLLAKSQYEQITSCYQNVGGICHHDYSERNVLFTPSGGIHLVDFDYCMSDLPVHDLVNFLRRVAKFTGYSDTMACRALTAYLDNNPLPKEELQLFIPLWLWPQKFWEVAYQYYGENRTRPRKKYLDRLRRRCRNRNRERRLLERIVSTFHLS